MTLLHVTDLKKVYGSDAAAVTALGGISFSVDEGEFVSVAVTTMCAVLFGVYSAVAVRGVSLASKLSPEYQLSFNKG